MRNNRRINELFAGKEFLSVEGRTAKQHKKWLAKQETKGSQMPVWGQSRR